MTADALPPAPTGDPSDPVDHGPSDPAEVPDLRGPRTVQRQSLERRVVTIGRGKTADIRLRDGRLSRKHCQIIPLGGTYLISDLDSRNGTVVNGAPVSKHLLRPGDCIVLGGFRLDFTGDALIITESLDAPAATPTAGTASMPAALMDTAGPADHALAAPAAMPDPPHVDAATAAAAAAPAPAEAAPAPDAPPTAPPAEPTAPPVEAPTPTIEAPPPPIDVAGRFAEYLRGLGADPALLARALAHVGAAPGAGTSGVTTAAVEPAPIAGVPDDDPAVVPSAFQLVPAAALHGAPDAGLVLAPPPGMPAADSQAATQRLHAARPGARWHRLLATARVRGGAAGASVAVHAALIACFSVLAVVVAQLEPEAPATIDLAPPADAVFEPEPAPPELPPAPSTERARARLAVAATDAAKIEIDDWRPEARPTGERPTAGADRLVLASRFDDVRARVPTSGAAPAIFANRFEPRRSAACKREGVPPEAVAAVEAGLRWVVAHQRPDGLWAAGAQGCEHPACAGLAGDPAYDVGVTGLALLAIAGQGEGGRQDACGAVVARALAGLAQRRQPDGWIGERRGKGIYGHLIATAAALELAAVTGRPAARALARGGIAVIERERVAGQGWRYRLDRAEADTAVTAWAGCTLALAARLGWQPDAQALRTAVDWTRRQYDPATSRVGYLLRGDGGSRLAGAVHEYPRAAAMSAAGAMVLLLAGAGAGDDVVQGALADVAQHAPLPQVRDCYAWQWGACALFQAGGRPADDYHKALRAALLPRQVADGGARGCFVLDDAWTAVGGRVYATAMATLALQAPWRYARVAELDK